MEDRENNLTGLSQNNNRQLNSPTVRKVLTEEEIKSYGLRVKQDSKKAPSQQGTPAKEIDIEQELRQIKAILAETASATKKQPPKIEGKIAGMQERSTKGTPSSNRRQTTRVDKKWQRIAVAIGIVGSMAIGGYLATPVDTAISYISNAWELHSMTRDFEKAVTNEYTTHTFTGDKSINYDKVAQAIEADGNFSNTDLLMAVDTLGEVNTNRVLEKSNNPPAPDVQTYMLDHNINNTTDWKDKTIEAMGLEQKISDSQTELNLMFGEKNNSNENIIKNEQSTGYGGK